MGGQEDSYPHGSADQATFPNNPNPSQLQPSSSLRQNPTLLRIHADDQDKKTTCMFWSVLFIAVVLLAIVGNFAIPSIYIKNNLSRSLSGTSLSACNNPSALVGTKLACQANPLYFGEVVVGWGPVNQFGLLYLEIRPQNLSQQINFAQNYLLQLYTLQRKDSDFYIKDTPSELNATINFNSNNADNLYADDGRTVIGYQYLMAVIISFDNNPFAEIVKFSQNLPTSATNIRLQSYAVNSRFTTYTIVLRYIFFAIAILTCVLYFIRFIKIPQDKKIIEQKMVAVASVLLIMFNDPFYPITVLKPNGVSAFFSLLFIVNLIAFLFLMWLVIADRIYFEDGQLETAQLSKKKIAYALFLWVLLLVCLMVYTMQQVSGDPFIPEGFSAKYMAARVIIGLTVFAGVAYIAMRFIRSCMAPQGRTWRNNLFMAFSSAFIFGVFIIVVSNSLLLYYYSGSGLLVVYSLINIYVYYIQYLFTITREEAEKLEHPEEEQENASNNNYDVITVGTIDLVDVNLDEDEERFSQNNVSKQNKKRNEHSDARKGDFQSSEFD